MSAGSKPVRTCVGCRRRAQRSDLVRIVTDRHASTSVVVVDPEARAPGRGCWVHPHPDCLDRALRRRAITRALRCTEPVNTDAVVQWFASNPLNTEPESGSTLLWEPDESPPMSTNH